MEGPGQDVEMGPERWVGCASVGVGVLGVLGAAGTTSTASLPLMP